MIKVIKTFGLLNLVRIQTEEVEFKWQITLVKSKILLDHLLRVTAIELRLSRSILKDHCLLVVESLT